jgi:pyridoxal 5'-phosphate synthase pdxT subunit
LRIGVLALQGDFREHQQLLESMGVVAVAVKRPSDLEDISGLIIPGGESTAISKLMVLFGLMQPIRNFVAQSRPILGTCAGMILLSDRVEGALPDQELIGGLDIAVSRNAYGSQNESFEGEVKLSGDTVRVAFIRAPKIMSVGAGVTVLATLGEEPVAVAAGNLMAASFHPEITGETALHQAFIELCKQNL